MMRRSLTHARTSSARLWLALRAIIGLDEVLLLVGFGLITVALWPAIGRLALLIPGAAIIWLVLPTRAPFLHRPSANDPPTRRIR